MPVQRLLHLGVIEELVDQNIAVVAAVGNDGPSKTSSPGNYAGVIAVGAVEWPGRVWRVQRQRDGAPLCAARSVRSPVWTSCRPAKATSSPSPRALRQPPPRRGRAGAAAPARAGTAPTEWKALLKRTARRPAGWDALRGGGAGILDARKLLSEGIVFHMPKSARLSSAAPTSSRGSGVRKPAHGARSSGGMTANRSTRPCAARSSRATSRLL